MFSAIPDSFDYSAKPVAIPVAFQDGRYELREASEDAHIDYQITLMRSTKFSGDKGAKPVIEKMDGVLEADSVLVAGCLFEVGKEGSVGINFVRKMPHRIIDALARAAKRISGMSDEETSAAIQRQIDGLKERLEAALVRESTGETPVKN